MGKYNNEKNDPRLIKKLATNRNLVSIIAPDFDSKYENVIFEFVEYDKNSKKKLKEIDIYFEADAFLGLCQQIIDKTVARGVRADQAALQAAGEKYSKSKLFFRRGGGEVPVYENGNAESRKMVIKYREFYIQASSFNNNCALLVAEQCDGYTDKIGLINPNGNNKEVIRIPIDFQALNDMACLAQVRMNAFYVAKQLSGAYTRVKNSNTAINTPYQAESPITPNKGVYGQPTDKIIEMNQAKEQQQITFTGVQEIDPDEAFYKMYATQYN